MRFKCTCGGLIRDITDCLPNKALYIVDQDYYDFFKQIDDAVRAAVAGQVTADDAMWHIRDTARRYCRAIYQCEECSRIWLEGEYPRMHGFVPEADDSAGMLWSAEGDKYRTCLRGTWHEDWKHGWLTWAADRAKHEETFANWEQLRDRYTEVYNQLKARRIIRGASLVRDAEVVHEWSRRRRVSRRLKRGAVAV